MAFAADALVGTIVLREQGDETLPKCRPELGGLFVIAAHRGQGVGTALVQAGMELARAQGYVAVYATTVAAAGILESLGWTFLKTVVHQDGPLALYECRL